MNNSIHHFTVILMYSNFIQSSFTVSRILKVLNFIVSIVAYRVSIILKWTVSGDFIVSIVAYRVSIILKGTVSGDFRS